MTTAPGIEIEGLTEFRRACRLAGNGLSRQVGKALRLAGKPPLERARALAARTTSSPRSTGALMKSYKIRTSGSSAFLQSGVPYGAGAEWGLYGKWSGFRKYPGVEAGGRGRFAWKAVQDERDEIAEIITKALEHLIEIEGWATP
jgi:phage gpG-like protein